MKRQSQSSQSNTFARLLFGIVEQAVLNLRSTGMYLRIALLIVLCKTQKLYPLGAGRVRAGINTSQLE